MINCNDCKNLNITEAQQAALYPNTSHVCMKYGIKLYHRSSRPKVEHNFIYPCIKCQGDDFKQR